MDFMATVLTVRGGDKGYAIMRDPLITMRDSYGVGYARHSSGMAVNGLVAEQLVSSYADTFVTNVISVICRVTT